MGLKYGWRYRYIEQFEQLRETRTISFWSGDDVYRLYEDNGIRACVYLHYGALAYRKSHYEGEPPDDLPFIIDPVWHNGYLAACRETCERHGEIPGIEYFFVVDEAYKLYTQAIIPKAERLSLRWAEMEREVREEYGAGLFGLPEGPDDENAYRWIAYLSWSADQLTQTFAGLREALDQSGCRARLLGPDELGFVCPLRWLFTGQALALHHTAAAYRAGFITKCAADFTGRPVHNATQIPSYGGSPSPEWVQELYSQVLRNGGEGEMLIAVEWFDRELNHHQYSAPERWATVKNLLELMATHEVATPGAASVGILYSSPSVQAMGRSFNDHPYLTAYGICGPVLGAWPRMVDSYALAESKQTLDGLTMMIVPHAPYEREEVLIRLASFVRKGGLLVCCEPDALSWSIHGGRLRNEKLLGVVADREGVHRSLTLNWPEAIRERVFSERCRTLRPSTRQTKVIGRYADGSPAATAHRFGKGTVIVFGASPVEATSVADDPDWASWWRKVCQERDVPMGLPIWRLRLPDEALVHATAPVDVCVTGNNFVRCQNGVYLGANDAMEGHYTLSVTPDLSSESGGSGAVAFSEGDLTDRTMADKGPFDSRRRQATEPYKESDWANRWSADALDDGLDIQFALPRVRDLTRVRFWFSGSMSKLAVQGLIDGQPVMLTEAEAMDVGEDIEVVELPLPGNANEVRLRFTPGTGSLAIADVELWAKPET
jgi:hypothetical protein